MKLSTHEMIEMTIFLLPFKQLTSPTLGKGTSSWKLPLKGNMCWLDGHPSHQDASNLYPWRLPLDPEPKDMTFRGKQRNDSDVMES